MIERYEGLLGTTIKWQARDVQGLQQPDGSSIFKWRLEN